MKKYYLAIDIGASSGRHIIGWLEEGRIISSEIYRFVNSIENINGHLTWNMAKIFQEVLNGLKIAFKKYGNIESMAIDTWGVDYVLMKEHQQVLPVYAYRDNRTEDAIKRVHNIIPFDILYGRTGIQFQPFNTIYQLFWDKLNGRLEGVTSILMIPEYLNYLLTGKIIKEYTNATTTGLIHTRTKSFDGFILNKLGFNEKLFVDPQLSGAFVGNLTDEISKKVKGQTKVILCNSHDTASAVFGIDMPDNGPYISSGTWSLLGMKQDIAHTDAKSRTDNFSNEGNANRTFRYQKNIMGMWIVNQTIKELKQNITVEDFVKLAEGSSYHSVIDINNNDFLSPKNMIETIHKNMINNKHSVTEDIGNIASCIFHSIAASYKESLEQLEYNIKKKFDTLYIFGGGAKNRYLNKLTEKYTGKKVIALPIEASAIGNLKSQIMAGEKNEPIQ
ncbi:MAG: rhamnulokinase [Clostridia bacterium]|nr:rhamnulokinase [Clostridia bacterium]